MVTTEEKVIGDRTYSITKLPAMKAHALSAKLIRMIGPPLAALLGSSNGASLGGMDVSVLGPAASMLFAQLTEVEFEKLTKELLATCMLNGQPLLGGAFDLTMQGRVDEIYTLMLFSIEVNFGNFFGGRLGEGLRALAGGSLFEVSKSTPSAGPVGG